MKTILILITLTITLLSMNSNAGVDGYKDLKFGNTVEQFQERGTCVIEGSGFTDSLMVVHQCVGFTFNGEKADTYAIFVDDKFVRLFINFSFSNSNYVFELLKDKYGSPSSSPTIDELNDVYTLPNKEAYTAFSDDTVAIRITSDNKYNRNSALIYQTADYEDLLSKSRKNSILNDL